MSKPHNIYRICCSTILHQVPSDGDVAIGSIQTEVGRRRGNALRAIFNALHKILVFR